MIHSLPEPTAKGALTVAQGLMNTPSATAAPSSPSSNSVGGGPVWTQAAFLDLFPDAKRHQKSISASGVPLEALGLIARALNSTSGKGSDTPGDVDEITRQAFSKVYHMLDATAVKVQAIMAAAAIAASAQEKESTLSSASQLLGISQKKGDDPRDCELMGLIKMVVNDVRKLAPHDTLVVPSCIPGDNSTAPSWVFWLLHRLSESEYEMVLCDTTRHGSVFHQTRFDTEVGQTVRQASVVVQNVTRERILDSAFWFLILRPAVYPSSPASVAKVKEPSDVRKAVAS